MPNFCGNCGKPMEADAKFCMDCGKGGVAVATAPAPQQQPIFIPGIPMNEVLFVRDLTQNQQLAYANEMQSARKNPDTAFWLAFLVGGIGGQHFYLGNTGRAVAYLLLCWTTVPFFISFFELFTIKEKVRQANQQNAMQTAMKVKTLYPA